MDNDYAPIKCPGGNRAPLGCVATATAQIMKYHQHPATYNWSAMPNHSGNNTVSRLMRDIGDTVGMDYSCVGSGAYIKDARNALVNVFGYSSSARYANYNLNTVVNELNNRRPILMRAYSTKYKTGWWIFKKTHYTGGHAWVCDGYKETIIKKQITRQIRGRTEVYTHTYSSGKYLNMNWGWGDEKKYKDLNGWFKYNGFTVTDINYQYKKMIVMGIKP